jgi:hypothetical protein
MIRTDAEYQQVRARLRDERQRLGEHEARMKEMNLSAAERKRALDPLQSFSAQLEEEMEPASERATRELRIRDEPAWLGTAADRCPDLPRAQPERAGGPPRRPRIPGFTRRAQRVRLDHGGASLSNSRGIGSRPRTRMRELVCVSRSRDSRRVPGSSPA